MHSPDSVCYKVRLPLSAVEHNPSLPKSDALTGAAETRLAAIVENSGDGIVGEDLKGNITSWNRGAEQIFGYTAEEAVGQPATILRAPEVEDDMQRILTALRRSG